MDVVLAAACVVCHGYMLRANGRSGVLYTLLLLIVLRRPGLSLIAPLAGDSIPARGAVWLCGSEATPYARRSR